MGTIKDFKYKKIKNFFTKKELIILSKYCEFKHRNTLPKINESLDDLSPADRGYYSDPLMESILLYKKDIVEKESRKKLYPTYSYWRMYTYGADLPKHTDRPSCEISITAHIDGASNKWPLTVDGTEVFTEPGDAVMYTGIDLEHKREMLNDDFQSQVFLHYVDKDGENASYKYDKRNMIGEGNDF